MECSQVLSLLSRYLDGDLTPEVTRMVEDHLAGCTTCSSHMEELTDSVRALRSLERIAAPQTFLSKVHHRIEEPSRVQRLLRKLFSPLYVKLPLEAFGLGIAVLLVITVHREMTPLKGQTMVSQIAETTAPAPAPSEKVAAASREEPPPALPPPGPPAQVVQNEVAPAAQPPQKAMTAVGARPAPPLPGFAAAPRKAAPATDHEVQPSPQAVKPIRLTLLIAPSRGKEKVAREAAPPAAARALSGFAAPSPPAGPRAVPEEAGAVPPSAAQDETRALRKQAAPPSGKQAPPATAAGGGQTTGDSGTALTLIRQCAAETGGTLLETTYRPGTGIPQSAVVEVPVSNYPALVEKLQRIGSLRPPYPETPPPGTANTVRVLISFLLSE